MNGLKVAQILGQPVTFTLGSADGITRLAFLELGRRLHARGLLPVRLVE
jgi:hypothetical protein